MESTPLAGHVVATSFQLTRHKDLGGSALPVMPFRLVTMPAPIGRLADDAAVCPALH